MQRRSMRAAAAYGVTGALLLGWLAGLAEGSGAAGGSELMRGLLRVGEGVRLTPEQYVTGILHELFHAWQAPALNRWMTRLDQQGADDAELFRTVYGDAENNRLQDREVKTLLAAINAQTADAAGARAQEFLAVRAQRTALWVQRVGPARAGALLDRESMYEWAEGLARYVEIRSWETAGDPAYQPHPELAAEPGYAAYAGGRQALLDRMAAPVDAAAPHERIYRLGALQALALDRVEPGWRARASTDVPLSELLRQAVGG